MAGASELRERLRQIDGRGYKAYKQIQGRYAFEQFTLFVDHVQGDPFAAPSRVRVRVPQPTAGFSPTLFSHRSRRIGLETALALDVDRVCRALAGRSGSGKSGLIEIAAPGQEMLERTAVLVTDAFVEARFVVGLPARGRTVLGRQAARMLCEQVPQIVAQALLFDPARLAELQRFAEVNEDADALRGQLAERGWVAFVADGSLLPRRSGVDDRPLAGEQVVAFASPDSLRHTVTLPNAGPVTGMAIPQGVTLIVGGGFHGKSTLLSALERGVYNHRPGDGREQAVAVDTAVKIRAEDGRGVAGVDISPFINNLPYGQSTRRFSTDNASGSTSQAANIIEALELGTRLLLIDEDTAATNFMIRDQRMQALIAKDREPITPFIDKVRQLYDERGVSTVLVIGGSGDYFDVADHIIALDSYVPQDVTAAAKAIAARHAQERRAEGGPQFGAVTARVPQPRSLDPRKGRRDVSVKTRRLDTIQFGTQPIDLSAVAQLVDAGQTRAIAEALVLLKTRYLDGQRPLRDAIDLLMADLARDGLDVLTRYPAGDLVAFRPFELGAALNRLRGLVVNSA